MPSDLDRACATAPLERPPEANPHITAQSDPDPLFIDGHIRTAGQVAMRDAVKHRLARLAAVMPVAGPSCAYSHLTVNHCLIGSTNVTVYEKAIVSRSVVEADAAAAQPWA